MLATLVVLLRSIGLICRGHHAVVLENLALRQQLAGLTRARKRPQLRMRDRLFWVCLASAWRGWRTALVVVHPDTGVRWHRQWLRRRWTWRSTRTRPGRPSTTAAIRLLVNQMGAANPLSGAPRIHGELGKLGIDVSERTVSRLLRRCRRPPSQTWRTFLTNHLTSLVSLDFFTAMWWQLMVTFRSGAGEAAAFEMLEAGATLMGPAEISFRLRELYTGAKTPAISPTESQRLNRLVRVSSLPSTLPATIPETLPVYRGVRAACLEKAEVLIRSGVSWTRSEAIAQNFANGMPGYVPPGRRLKGHIGTGVVDRTDVLAYVQDHRSEFEVVVDGNAVRDLNVTEKGSD